MKRKNVLKKRKENKLNTESNPLTVEYKTNTFIKNRRKSYCNIKNKYTFYIITIIISIIALIGIYFLITHVKLNDNLNINKPFLPLNKEEIPVKEYHKTKYDSSKLRFHFEELYENRTIFKINYSYKPYAKIKKSLSFDENGKMIFENTGMLNMTLLNAYYYNNVTMKRKLNHIHVCMGMDKNVILLSLISMSSLLNNSSPNTFIHIHIMLINCVYEDIQLIYSLNYINKNVEFIFYNAKQAEYDFSRGLKEDRGVGDYTRVLAPEIVNNTNRIIILDSGDLIVNNDLSEFY